MSDAVTFKINRTPVMTLWAAIVAERLGFDHDEALTLGRAVAGLNAQSKGTRIGIFEPSDKSLRDIRAEQPKDSFEVSLLHRSVPVISTPDGIRAIEKGKPTNPGSVESYLEAKFGDNLTATETAMAELAKRYTPRELNEVGYSLYEQFRPAIPEGVKGWGAKGTLAIAAIRKAGLR